jgi:Protein of unknown function (DUF3617)
LQIKFSWALMGLALSANVALAAVPAIKPGLWELTSKSNMAAPDVSKMSADERERFEKNRAEREERIKQMQQPRPVCISGEMVSKGHWFGSGRRGAECEFSNVKTTAKLVTYDVACTGQRTTAGKGKLTMIAADKFSGESSTKSAEREIKITTTGTWKAADCGSTIPNYPNIKK